MDIADRRRPKVCFLFNAQAHQLLHGISVAVELARLGTADVHVVAPMASHLSLAKELADRLGGGPLHYRLIGPAAFRALAKLGGASVPPKAATLLLSRGAFRDYDAIVLPERTSLLLRKLGLRDKLYIHTDHGAGDRAAGFDSRISQFDFVLLAGRKQRERMLREGLIRDGRFAEVGYPKFDAADAVRVPGWTPFRDDKPVVLYNPHFHPRLSSWWRFGLDVLRAFAASDHYNLVFAPHVRLFDSAFARWSARRELRRFLSCPNIHVDLGSMHSVQMTYTTLADVYLGDVSSQVYEYLRTSKPCLFLNATGAAWQGDENYRHWTFGPVRDDASDLIAAVDRSRAEHAAYKAVQEQAFEETFALTAERSSLRAARAIAGFLDASRLSEPAQ